MLEILLAHAQEGDGKFARDGRKRFEEVVKREAVGEIVEQRFHRDTSAFENRRASEDVGINGDEIMRLHSSKLAALRPGVKLAACVGDSFHFLPCPC